MLGDWCDGHPAALELFTRASSILGYDLAAICRHGPAEKLNATSVSQPAILVTSLAALEVLKSRDPALVAGAAEAAERWDGPAASPAPCQSSWSLLRFFCALRQARQAGRLYAHP